MRLAEGSTESFGEKMGAYHWKELRESIGNLSWGFHLGIWLGFHFNWGDTFGFQWNADFDLQFGAVEAPDAIPLLAPVDSPLNLPWAAATVRRSGRALARGWLQRFFNGNHHQSWESDGPIRKRGVAYVDWSLARTHDKNVQRNMEQIKHWGGCFGFGVPIIWTVPEGVWHVQ